MCEVLGVSASGYYAWSRRPESAHTQRDRQLQVLVRASFEASKHRYGSPRIHEDLLEQDARVSRKRVIRLMQADGLKARARKRFKCTTLSDHDQPVAANLLDRQFTADAPNRRWVGDTTEFVIGDSGKLYLVSPSESECVALHCAAAARMSRCLRRTCRWNETLSRPIAKPREQTVERSAVDDAVRRNAGEPGMSDGGLSIDELTGGNARRRRASP